MKPALLPPTQLSTLTLPMPRRSTTQAFKASMRGPSPSPPADKHPYKNWAIKPTRPKSPKDLPPTSPSASILLISPQNRVLLLHRTTTAHTFASAHVFPGGHLSPQDGPLPPPSSPSLHEDTLPYRNAAIRECFEESGILLARSTSPASPHHLLQLTAEARDEGRKAVHSEQVRFDDWVRERGGKVDTQGLIPFTRWLTPANIDRRFSTQMYLYFLPLSDPLPALSSQPIQKPKQEEAEGEAQAPSTETSEPAAAEQELYIPTPDGGIEHTAARFLYPSEWITLAQTRKIILFPPQFFLLTLLAQFLSPNSPQCLPSAPSNPSNPSPTTTTTTTTTTTPLPNQTQTQTQHQRTSLLHFITTDGDPPWGEKCISPDPIMRVKGKYLIMGLAKPGPEVERIGRKGDGERVIRVELEREGEGGRQRPRPVAVEWRRDVVGGGVGGRGRGKL